MLLLILISIVKGQVFNYIPTQGTPPDPRFYSCLAYRDIDKSLFVFGGYDDGTLYNDLFLYNITTDLWSRIYQLNALYPRKFYVASRYSGFLFFSDLKKDTIYLYGGNGPYGPLSDLWSLTLSTRMWIPVFDASSINPFYDSSYTTFLFNKTQYIGIFGGYGVTQDGSLSYTNDLYLLDLKTYTGTTLPKNGNIPSICSRSSLGYYKNNIYLVTSGCGNYTYGWLYRYDLYNNNWSVISDARYNCISIGILNNYLYIFDTSYTYKIDLDKPTFYSQTFSSLSFINLFGIKMILGSDTLLAFGFYSLGATNRLFKVPISQIEINQTDSNYNTSNFIYPHSRFYHSLNAINTFLYLFGGFDGTYFYNDLWIFDTNAGKWEASIVEGTSPSARAYHAASASGDALLLWGGRDSTKYLNDMFLYNTNTQTWSEVIPSSSTIPSERIAACMVFNMPLVYIFGGETNNGINGELWQYDFSLNTYTLILIYPTPIAYASCQIMDDVFYVLCGSTKSNKPHKYIVSIYLNNQTWTSIKFNECLTKNIALKLGDNLITLGGRSYKDKSNNVLTLVKEETENSGNSILKIIFQTTTPFFPYNLAFTYLGSKIYFVYGGEVNIYGLVNINRPSNLFLSLDLSDIFLQNSLNTICSPGYYLYNSICQPCPEGYYTENYGSVNCTPCSEGKYMNKIGSASIRQCIPCPKGSFSDQIGAKICLDCPQMSYCGIGSTSPSLTSPTTSTVQSIQPEDYSQDNSTLIFNFQIYIALVLGIIVLILIVLLNRVISKIDFFSNEHTYKIGDYVQLKKTTTGGILTLIFISVSILLIGTIFLGYFYNGILETKLLQPLVVLENQIGIFKADIKVTAKFYLYGDKCVVGSECSDLVGAYSSNFQYIEKEVNYCYLIDQTCEIHYECYGCSIQSQATVYFFLKELFSYSTSISLNVRSTSSIPDSISSYNIMSTASSNTIYTGHKPTVFSFTMVSSLFESSVSNFPSQQTGYHVSQSSATQAGSESSVLQLTEVYSLGVQVVLTLSSTALYTNRSQTQSFLLVVSGLLGSIVGIMGACKFLMRFVEKHYILTNNCLKKNKAFMKIKKNRKKMMTNVKDDEEDFYLF